MKSIIQLCDLCSKGVFYTFDFRLSDTGLIVHICKVCRKHFKPTKDWTVNGDPS